MLTPINSMAVSAINAKIARAGMLLLFPFTRPFFKTENRHARKGLGK